MNFLLSTMFILMALTMPQNNSEVVAKINAHYKTVQSIQADFTQKKYSSIFPEPLVTKGLFLFERPEKIRWEQTQPTPNYFVINGEKYIEFDGTKRTVSTKGNAQTMAFKSMILGTVNGSILSNKNFTNSVATTTTENVVTLHPNRGRLKKHIAHIALHFSKKTNVLNRMVIAETATEKTEYIFSNQQLNAPINPQKFN